jgi:hypothetical protein
LLRDGQNKINWQPLYTLDNEYVDKKVVTVKNRAKSWQYGYDKKNDVVVISKDGTIGDIYNINGVRIALPKQPKEIDSEHNKWVAHEVSKELSKIKTRAEWRMQEDEFKEKYVDYITGEFDKRENGYWFMNNGKPTYITGHHYMYLQHTKIDVGHPDFREANRIFYIYWEACKADDRCFGMIYLKIRRSGFSFMGSSVAVDTATLAKDARIGMLSKTGPDAKKLFTDKVVPISINYPFYFKPLQAGMDRPKTELMYGLPATKITKNNMHSVGKEEEEEGLDTSIDWKNTDDNSYDGEKLLYLLHDECYSPDTKILTADMEFKPIKDIKIGDKVIVEGGKIKTVMKVASGETDMYRVKQKWGKDYVVSRNHRLVLDQYKYRRNGKTTREEVIMTPPEYLNLSKYAKQHTFSVKSKGLHFEDSDDISIPPYMLGLWLGDGSSNCGKIIVNHKKDPEILAYLGRIAQMVNRDFSLAKSDSDSAVYFRLNGFRTELGKLNLINNKHVPKQYMMSSIETRLQLLAGLIDSDGFVDKKKKCIVIGMSRPELIDQIRVLAHSCGLSCSSMMHSTSNFNTDVYSINISGDLSIVPTIVERKMMTDYTPTYTNRRCGMDVEYIGKGEFYGIQVDGENDDERKLILEDFTISMNSSKWIKPLNILNNWRVTKTCLRLGRKVVGKCLMGSTCNALSKGGDNFKALYMDSDPNERSANGQTRSGLYRLFIPMEWNFEGYIDEYGFPVFETPKKPVMGVDGEEIDQGVIEYWNNEVDSLKSNADALNEFYRQFPRTEAHAFRDESKESLFNLTKIYEQIDYNDGTNVHQVLTRGSFHWKDGKRFSEVVWSPDKRGRFLTSWLPPAGMRNGVMKRGDLYYPKNEEIGAFGCDSYDISGTVGGGASNGALHGVTRFNMTEAPSNEFFLEYVARPQTAEIFFEDVIMAIWFYGMPILVENNKPRLLYALKNAGMRNFSINRPDKARNKLSKTEKELGGIPNSSEDVRQAHAACIEAYIEKYVGVDSSGVYRLDGEVGNMFFNRTLEDWARFEYNNRTKYDASISSGLALMAIQRFDLQPKKEKSKININFVRYDNTGFQSKIIKG